MNYPSVKHNIQQNYSIHLFFNLLDWLVDGFGVFDGMVAYLQTKGQN